MVDEALPSTPVEILGMNSSAYAEQNLLSLKMRTKQKTLSEFKQNNSAKNKFWLKIKPLYLKMWRIKKN